MTTRTTRWKSLSSSVGTKVLIALTGLASFLYLIVHLAGNLLLFTGAGTFNGYAQFLVTNPLIVPVEIGLAAIFIIHIYKGVVVWWTNRGARPEKYYRKDWTHRNASRKTFSSTTMFWTGLVILAFVILHVKTFKFGTEYQVAGNPQERDLYRLVVETFHNPAWVIFYEACLVLLGFHLWHAFWSSWDSLGFENPRVTPGVVVVGKVLAIAIAGGFFLIPIIVYFSGMQP